MEPITENVPLLERLEYPQPEELYPAASAWAEEHYAGQIKWVRGVVSEPITKERFWREYCWCSLVSGFNAARVTKFFPAFMAVAGEDPEKSKCTAEDLQVVFGNKNKTRGIIKCRNIITGYGWRRFCEKYVQPKNVDLLNGLPNVGPVISHHLARNLGIDTVKPDLHLNRLANYYDFGSALEMCQMMQKRFGVATLGEVDLKLFLFCQAHGTKHLDDTSRFR